jgi:dienelactone hydrolase
MKASALLLVCLAVVSGPSLLSGQAASPFDYNASAPLNPRVIQRVDTVGFVREKIVFDGGRGSRVPALVAVPKSGPRAKPVVLLIDGIGGWKERWWSPTGWNRGRFLVDGLLAAGFAVAMADAPASGERTFENDFVTAEAFIRDTVKWREMGVKNAIESRRFLDYLASRPDIDATRIGVLGLSHGGMMTFALAANEPRIKAAVSGLAPLHRIPTVLNPLTYAPRVRIPLLMFAATNDAWYTRPLVDSAFDLIPSKAKRLAWYGTGHRPPTEYANEAVSWFRSTLKSTTGVVANAASAGVPSADRSLRIVDTVVVDTRRAELVGEPQMALRSDGSLAILAQGRQLVYFDSAGRQRWARTPRGDVFVVSAIGWNGDSLYLADNVTDQTLLVASNGGVGRIIDSPDMIRPLWKDRGTSTAYGAFDVYVRLENGSLIGTPRRPHRFGFYGPKKAADPNIVTVVGVNADGIIEHQLASGINPLKGDKWFALPDGRVVIARGSADSLRLIAISPEGDTLFKRGLPSVKGVLGAVGGPDGTIWLSSTTPGQDITHTALDARGDVVGVVSLASPFRVGAGDAKHLWVWDNRGANKPVFRYTVRP